MTDGDISLNLRLDDKDFTVTVKNSGRLLSELRQNLDTTAGAAKRAENHFSSFSTHLRHTVMTLASIRFAAMDFNDVFLALPRSIIKTSGEIERLTKLMEGLSKESTKAARELEAKNNTNYIFDMAKNAPFEVKALSDAFVKFKSAGLDPTNGSMKALVDSVAKFGGDSQSLHRASIAIQQMAGKGVISMEELRQQLGEAVPTAMQNMATGMGMSMQTLIGHISKGQVESKSALERMFAVMRAENDGASAAMMTTWTGTFERLKTTWDLAKVEMGRGGLFDTAKEEVNKLIDAFDSTQMRSFMNDVAFVTAEAAKGFSVLINSVREYYDEIKTAGAVFVSAFAATKILSMGKAVFEPIVRSYRAGVADMIAAANERDTAERVAHSNAIARAKQREAQMVEEARVAQATFAQENAQYNAMVTERRALDREQSKFKTAAYAQLLQAQIAALEAEMLATKNSAIAHAGRAQSLTAEIAATRANIAALESQVIAQNQATAAGTRFAGIKGMLSGVWTAMGGWIGIATMALTAGIMAWADYAQAAERASQRAKNAARGISDAAGLAAAVQERDRLGEQLVGHWNQAEYKKERERYDELNEEIKQHRENIEKDRVDHAVTVAQREADRQKAGITDAWRTAREAEIKAVEDGRKALEVEYAGNAKGLKAALEKYNKEHEKDAGNITRKNDVGRLTNLRAFMENQNARLREELTGANADRKAVITELLAKNDTGIKEMTGLIDQANKIGTESTLLNSKKEGGGKKDELTSWLERVQDRLATLNGELNKEGSGTLARMFGSDLDQIKGMTDAKKKALTEAYRPKLEELEAAVKGEGTLRDILASVKNQAEETDIALAGGVTGLQKMRNALAAIGKENPNNLKIQDGIKAASQAIDELEKKKSKLDFRDLSSDLLQATEALRAGMSDNPNDSIYAKWAKDIEDFRKKIDEAKLSAEDAERAQQMLEDYTRARNARMLRDTEHPLQGLAREWENTTKQMRDASTRWADQTVDTLVGFAKTSKLEWRSLVDSISTDMLRMNIKEWMGKGINTMFDAFKGGKGGKEGIGSVFDGITAAGKKLWDTFTGVDRSAGDAADATTKSAAQTLQEIIAGTTKMTAEQAATTSLISLAQAAAMAAAALGGKSAASGLGGFSSIIGSIGGMFGGFSGIGESLGELGSGTAGIIDAGSGFGMGADGLNFTGSLGAAEGGWGVANIAGTTEAASFMTDVWSGIPFANGGIMTEFGTLPLQKYAKGGIARSPQAAIFGEGSLPEAYVPLPDGRSIPVTMTAPGGAIGGQNVTISIVVNNDGSADSSQSSGDDAATWRSMAEKVKTVVVETIVKEKRPGGILS